ncbi:MAG: 4Fe-4S dicluster domain-containing protein, partial [Deltaproteobacteria bacterium]|nr:4Fe-4S dicluster domain-containing protein [Deltaproteobacteria bacterium]
MSCGACTALCPAAEFHDFSPREIMTTAQEKNEEAIVELLKSETIWYCYQCGSCKTKCP